MEKSERKKSKAQILKELKNQNMLEFMRRHSKEMDLSFEYEEKMKLTSSDNFSSTIKDLSSKYRDVPYPIILGQVSGFFETASLVGSIANVCKQKTKPSLIFFDKNPNNIINAIFNTLLIECCESKEEYLVNIFQLSYIDILKAFSLKDYEKLIEKAKNENKELVSASPEEIDQYILNKYLDREYINYILKEKFSLSKLETYISGKKYDKEKHLSQLLQLAKKSLNPEMYEFFEKIAKDMCEYFSKKDNFSKHIEYLFKDMKRNKDAHILCNEEIFKGFKSLVNKDGTGTIKFLPNIDISKEEGLAKLESILRLENIISDGIKQNEFPIDVAVIPHIRRLKSAFSFLKKNSQYFVETNREHLKEDGSGKVLFGRTIELYIPDYQKIGAEFIEEELGNQPELSCVRPIEALEGLPNVVSIAGINFGYIYTDYVALNNIIVNAKIDKVDTILIQSLIYSEHKRNQTKRRNLTDPKYPTLGSRLKAAKALVDDLNASGIKVVYQLGDEDFNLRDELFYTYFYKELKQKYNFLARKDMDEKFDWAKEIISDDLIPYLLRSGKDITTYYTSKGERKTRIGDICSYISAIKYGAPLGNLAGLVDENGEKLIDERYFRNTDEFKVVSESEIRFDKKPERLSIDMVANPNFSKDTQYANPDSGILKRIKDARIGATRGTSKPQVISDARQGYMAANVIGGDQAQIAINVPQLTDDSRYLKKGFMPNKKQIPSDPVHKRVTQPQNRLNFPGSFTYSGSLDEIFRITPCWRSSREIQEAVQRSGQPLIKRVEAHINDIQTGSITERLELFLKYLDLAMYGYNADVFKYYGDLIQGWNYDRYATESRHTSAQSVDQQMVDFCELQRPYVSVAFGAIPPRTFVTDEKEKILIVDEELSNLIIDYLYGMNLIDKRNGENGYVYSIKRNFDYNIISEIPLPERLEPYRNFIKIRLNTIKYVSAFLMVHGNHEANSDKLHKGYKPTEILKMQLSELKKSSGAVDVDIKYAEYIINSVGDIVEGSYSYNEINGYKILGAHSFKVPGKGSGGSACRNMANWLESHGIEYRGIDIVEQGHLHNFEMAVLNEKLYIVVPGMAGQSGFEQMLGYSSHPRGMIKTFWEDGRFSIDLISPEFLDSWEIQNPEIKRIGLESHIKICLNQEAIVISDEMPEQIHVPSQRTIGAAALTKILGPSIKR